MHANRSGWIRTMLVLGLLVMWLSPPGVARALDVDVTTDGYAAIAVPATEGAVQLWVDVEAPGLDAADVVLRVDGVSVALRNTPFGAGVILEHDGTARSLEVGLLVPAEPDIAITLADAEGRVLLGHAARVPLDAVDGEQPAATTPPPTEPPATTDPPDTGPPATTPPPATTAPPTTTPPATKAPPGSAPPTGPRPWLPSTGVDTPTFLAGISGLLVVGAALVALRGRGDQS